ncbi:MAG: ATP-binding protein [Cyclobacteriaceae bacterium]
MPDQIKKVVVIGPESTGKSTLTAALAKHYQEPWVPEYARDYLYSLNRGYHFEDLLKIAKGQIEKEIELEEKADGLLFCDTDLHVIKVWSEHSFGKLDPWIKETMTSRRYDLYLLTDIDVPWEPDPLREHPHPKMRKYFFDLYHEYLKATGVPYLKISGDPQARLNAGIQAVDLILAP